MRCYHLWSSHSVLRSGADAQVGPPEEPTAMEHPPDTEVHYEFPHRRNCTVDVTPVL